MIGAKRLRFAPIINLLKEKSCFAVNGEQSGIEMLRPDARITVIEDFGGGCMVYGCFMVLRGSQRIILIGEGGDSCFDGNGVAFQASGVAAAIHFS